MKMKFNNFAEFLGLVEHLQIPIEQKVEMYREMQHALQGIEVDMRRNQDDEL